MLSIEHANLREMCNSKQSLNVQKYKAIHPTFIKLLEHRYTRAASANEEFNVPMPPSNQNYNKTIKIKI